jgi:hypothetical protein
VSGPNAPRDERKENSKGAATGGMEPRHLSCPTLLPERAISGMGRRA